VLLVPDDPGAEAVAEEVALTGVAAVELERVCAVQELHARGEIVESRLDDEVVVVAHQAEGVDLPVVAPDSKEAQAQELPAVVVVPVDARAVHAFRGDVVDAFGR
jgi:hypothetical protein